MRKHHFQHFFFFLTMTCVLCMAAQCDRKITKGISFSESSSESSSFGESSPVPALKLAHIAWADSMSVKDAQSLVRYDCMLPVDGPEACVDSILGWIIPMLADSTAAANFRYTSEDDCKAFIERQGKAYLQMDYAELKSMAEDGFAPGMERDFRVRVAYEDSTCITFLITTYTYLGGAHGYSGVLGATFSKTDGHHMTYADLLAGRSAKQLRKEIREGLKTYFMVETDEELRDNLFGQQDLTMNSDEYEAFPLPGTDPWLEKDGVHLIYQQYEIACYAAGMPAVVLKPSRP